MESENKLSVEEIKEEVLAEAERILDSTSPTFLESAPDDRERRTSPGSYDLDNLDEEDRASWAG